MVLGECPGRAQSGHRSGNWVVGLTADGRQGDGWIGAVPSALAAAQDGLEGRHLTAAGPVCGLAEVLAARSRDSAHIRNACCGMVVLAPVLQSSGRYFRTLLKKAVPGHPVPGGMAGAPGDQVSRSNQ